MCLHSKVFNDVIAGKVYILEIGFYTVAGTWMILMLDTYITVLISLALCKDFYLQLFYTYNPKTQATLSFLIITSSLGLLKVIIIVQL